MTRHVPISEFKDHASELVAAAEGGEEIVITRHGRAAARLIATTQSTVERKVLAREALARIIARRERLRSEGKTATIDELIAWKNEGQR
jgi:prevent-host-death family protein